MPFIRSSGPLSKAIVAELVSATLSSVTLSKMTLPVTSIAAPLLDVMISVRYVPAFNTTLFCERTSSLPAPVSMLLLIVIVSDELFVSNVTFPPLVVIFPLILIFPAADGAAADRSEALRNKSPPDIVMLPSIRILPPAWNVTVLPPI